MKIKLFPKTHKAKNRINEHGDIMELLHKNPYDKTILVKSLNHTFNGLTGKEHWMGWFHEDDVNYEVLDGEV